MGEVKRFDFDRHSEARYGDDGYFVLASDHDRAVAKLRTEVEQYQFIVGHLKGVLEGIFVFAEDADMRREFARRALEKIAAIEGVSDEQ